MRTDWSLRETRLELAVTILMAMATVASAWCAYQSTRWSGVQILTLGAAGSSRASAVIQSTLADQLGAIDVQLFVQYIAATASGDEELARFIARRFRPEFRGAFDAWLRTNPLKNPDAPPSPFAMPEYKLEAQQKAHKLNEMADRQMERAKEYNQNSDNYVMLTVVFALVLFFASIATKLAVWPLRIAVVVIGTIVFLGTLAALVTYPVH